MIELERTFLAKTLPPSLKNCKHKEIFDKYFPKESHHPVLRLRKNGTSFELTKKEPINNDPSHQEEQTIVLSEKEFLALRLVPGREVRKMRYYYPYNNLILEFDIFQDALQGLVLVDVEFTTKREKDSFVMPDFCLAEVTKEVFIAGGMLCGKSFSDIEQQLATFKYKKLFL